MLQSLHGAAKRGIGIILLLVLFLSFIVWGIADVFSSSTASRTSPIKVGDLDIAAQQLQNEVRQEISYISQLTGRTLSMKEAADFGLINRTVETLIARALLEQEALRLGLRVPDEAILATVREIPQLKNPDGSFNAQAFRAALANAGMTEKSFIESQRVTLAREQLAKAVGGAKAPALLVQALQAARAETRTIETYQLKFAGMPAIPAPSDEQLNAFIKDHADQFTKPEYRQLSFIRLSVETVGQDLAVTDEELNKAYEDRKDEFDLPEQRSFVQVVAPDKVTAEAIARATQSGDQGKDPLWPAAKAHNLTPATLNKIARDDLPEELREAAFALSARQVSAPVESPLGWHVLQATEIVPAKTQQLADVKDKIIADIRAQKAGDLIIKESQQLEDLLASSASLKEISEALNQPVQQVAAVDAGGKDDKGNAIGNVLGKPVLLNEAFKLAEGSQSGLIVADDDYYVVKVDSVSPSALKSLSEVRAAATAAYIKAEQQKLATLRAEELAKALKAGQSFEGAANQFKAESSVEAKLTRSGAMPAYLPENFTDNLFKLKANEVMVATGKDAITVVRLQKIEHPLAIADAKPDAQLSSQQSEMSQAELLQAYTTALRDRYPVKVDQKQLDNLFRQEADEQ